MTRYWKFFSVLPGAILMILVGLDVIAVTDSQAIESAIAALIAALGPLLSPPNTEASA